VKWEPDEPKKKTNKFRKAFFDGVDFGYVLARVRAPGALRDYR
jgi:hypothetical protein